MVALDQSGPEPWILAEPNRSANWSMNKLLIAVLAVWCLLLATVAGALGLWPIIPFLGLELAALAAGLYYVCWKLRQRHVLRLSGDVVVVQKGTYYPRFTWRLPRSATSLSVAVPHHPWDPLTIHICCRTEQILLGEFLNKEDSRALLGLLREQGLPVRNHSALARIDL